jgi:hypothetical protein
MVLVQPLDQRQHLGVELGLACVRRLATDVHDVSTRLDALDAQLDAPIDTGDPSASKTTPGWRSPHPSPT